MQGADPNSIDDGGLPALALAVTNKCPHAVLQALLAAGADPDGIAPTGSPLQVSVTPHAAIHSYVGGDALLAACCETLFLADCDSESGRGCCGVPS